MLQVNVVFAFFFVFFFFISCAFCIFRRAFCNLELNDTTIRINNIMLLN